MSPLRKLTTTLQVPIQIELYDRRRDNLVRIENHPGLVVIRTMRGDLPETAKASFLQYLAAEGFIAERYRWASVESNRAGAGVQWVADASWVGLKHQCNRLASRVWAFLTWGRLTAIGLFVAALVTAIWLKPR